MNYKILNKLFIESCSPGRKKVSDAARPLIKSLAEQSIERRKKLLEDLERIIEAFEDVCEEALEDEDK